MVSIYKTYTNIALLLCLTLLIAQTVSAQFTGNAWSQFSVNGEVVGAKAVCDDADIDNDNDGLIELCYLEDVNAMRHQPDGSGYKANAQVVNKTTTGCKSGGCIGYELVRDLDFTVEDSYHSPAKKGEYTVTNWDDSDDKGWQPIGDFNDPFNSIFEGNGHTISNLTINRSGSNIGLFGKTGSDSKISNIGLLNVSVKGHDEVGGLVGDSEGSITNSYVAGSVEGIDAFIGGLAGVANDGVIMNSYATGSVIGDSIVGGLTSESYANIVNSYSTSSVKGDYIGGLVSYLDSDSDIENSYSTGFVDGLNNVGGLTESADGDINNSYWDTVTSEISANGDSSGKATTDLISPTMADGIYSMWSTENWDFGTPNQYPAVKYARGDDAEYLACREAANEKSQQPVCATLLRGQRNSQPRILYPTTTTEILITGNAGTIKAIPVRVFDVDAYNKLTLFLSAEDVGQNLVELVTTKTEVITNGNPERGINEDLKIKVPQMPTFEMTRLQLIAKDDSGFSNAMSKPVLFKVGIVANTPPTITHIPNFTLPAGTSTTLNVVISDVDGNSVKIFPPYSDKNAVATAAITPTSDKNHILKITALGGGTTKITVTIDDGEDEANSRVDVEFEVTVVADEAPMLAIESPPSSPIELDAEMNVVITIQDANFDLGDSVTLEVTESTSSVVSGVPEDDIVIKSNTTRTFTFTGLKVGETRISFTATDINGEQSTVSVLLSVFSSLTTSTTVPTDPVIVPLGVAYSLDTKPFFTQSGSGISYAATGLPNGLTFTDGVISGTPTTASTNTDAELVKVTASDGRGGSAEATFTLLINAEPTVAAVTIKAINVNTWRLTATVDFEDKNGRDETKTRYQWFRAGPGDPPNYTGVQSGPEDTYMILNNNTGRAGGTRYKVEVTFVDNIGQSVTKSSAIYMIDNEAPMIKAISQRLENGDGTVNRDGTVNEGGTVSITANASDLNYDRLRYTWRVTSKGQNPRTLTSATSNNGQFSFDVPANWIKDTSADNTTRTLSLKIVVSDGSLSATPTAEVVVTKFNNGASATSPGIDRDDNTNELTLKTGTDNTAIAADPDNGGDEDSIGYQWQWCQSPCLSWMDISGQTGSAYPIPDMIETTGVGDNDRFRLEISYTDGQGYGETIFTNSKAKSATADIRVRAKVFLEGPLQ